VVQPIPRSGSPLETFLPAAVRYWLGVFPCVNREVRYWEGRARAIPDPALRKLALTALKVERGNLEGAAAFAAFLPRARRGLVVRALVAFQAVYDYADALSEQASAWPSANAARLHRALAVALGCQAASDFYRHHPRCDDAGYLHALVDCCWKAVRALPSYATVAAAAQAAATRIAAYQSLNLSEHQGGRGALERWALSNAPPHAEMHWWETAAAAGSSLLVFALVAAAARPGLDARAGEALAQAYYPWIGALHTLLDSLVDEAEDAQTGHRSLIDYYGSPQRAASRLRALAAESTRQARTLPGGPQHSLILAAMTCFYLSGASSCSRYAHAAKPVVLAALGRLAGPTMLVMRTRRRLSLLARRLRSPPRRGRADRPNDGPRL
jgi:tetraprenyl-beta-curcumene synthase